MLQKSRWKVLFAAAFFLFLAAGYARYSVHAQSDQALHIDVPVKLEKANVVVDVGHAVMLGDTAFFLGDIHLLASDLSEWNAPAKTCCRVSRRCCLFCAE